MIRTASTNSRDNEAPSLFLQNIQHSVCSRSDHQVFTSILKACAAISAIKLGKVVHGFIVKTGHVTCQSIYKAILNMYAKCGSFRSCQKVFDEMGHSDPVAWNIVLSGFSKNQTHDAKVMSLLYKMHTSNLSKPSSVTVAIALPVCARLQDLNAGKSLHCYVIKSGLESDTLIGNALVSVYAKCGLVLNDAYSVFNGIYYKDVVSWNAMISGFSENALTDNAFKMFLWMMKGNIEPNYATIVSILPVCAITKNIDDPCRIGKEIHGYALRHTDLREDISVFNALTSFYLRVGQMELAEVVFRSMKFRDLVSWNAIIAGFAANNEWLKALKMFSKFLFMKNFELDSVTLISILPVCAHLQKLQVGEMIHGYILRHSYLVDCTEVGNALISFYSNFDELEAAVNTFSMMSKRDLISWNAMLDAYAESACETQFAHLFHGMFIEGIRPDSITMLSIIRCFSSILRVKKVKEAHGYSIRTGFLSSDVEPTLTNAILDAYAKGGSMDYALKIFESLSEKKNVVTCNSIISGYINCGSHDNAHMLFKNMNEMDLTTWNLMIRAYAQNDNPYQALTLFYELQLQGRKPDTMTLMSLLPVCAKMASFHLLRQCHGYTIRSCFGDICLKGAILDVYSKCGSISCAYKLFKSTPHKDLVMFTAMVSGYAIHGMGNEALKIFYHMLQLGVTPDHVIITAVLSACSHSGLLDQGLRIFNSICKVHSIKPTLEHYACVVDLLTRGGRMRDAYLFVKTMPIEANANIWGTLLGGCRTHGEVELGRIVAGRLLELEADDIGSYVVMSNLYASDGRWDDVMQIRKMMKARDLKKSAGCSWIEFERKKNVFIAGDSAHPQRSIIYSTLKILDQQIKEYFIFESMKFNTEKFIGF